MAENVGTTAPLEGAVIEKVANATATTSGKEKTLKIKFLMSPTGKYNLAYGPGEKASFPKLQAEELIEAGYAELVK